MEPVLRRARRLVRSQPAPPPARPVAELTYLAVVNGGTLWIAAQVPGTPSGRLALVHRHRKEVRPLPPPTPADLAGQHLPAGALVAACRTADVLATEDQGIWDVAVLGEDGTPHRPRLAAHAEVYPQPPVAVTARPDGVRLRPYRTKDGRGSIQVDLEEPGVEVTRLLAEPGRLALTLHLNRWSGPAPDTLVLTQRRGTGGVSVPLDPAGHEAVVSVPLDLVARQCRDAPASVWDVAVDGASGRVRCGRTASDVVDPRLVHRYATHSYQSPDGGPPLVFRPYFTKDRFLAVEIDGAEQPAARA